MNTAETYHDNKNITPADPASSGQIVPKRPLWRTAERKIGRATFIVSSRFGEGREKDIISTITRLIQQGGDGGKMPQQSRFLFITKVT